ncbi:hypothetical protein CDD81_7952 [Ophiocordyceps australis]|uniref:Uncharacterized protein n=1 Tax=Ophiocordyceps australis TaxID=1399860 RepID=A0A2C5XGI3_9HYPO|nr:hypothetical protein CDD81_7952 [Ophiocordyceps australis]
MEGNQPYLAEVFFQTEMEPEITDYKEGFYHLGSKEYRYDASRLVDKYWTEEKEWHTHNTFKNLDKKVEKFKKKHKPLTVIGYDEGKKCYKLDTLEWYCPWEIGTKKFYTQDRGFYAVSVAPSPSDKDIVNFLEGMAAGLSLEPDAPNEDGPLIVEILTEFDKFEKKHAQRDAGSEITGTQDMEEFALFLSSAANGYKAFAKFLLILKPQVCNTTDKDGRTPLSLAAGNGHEAIALSLIGLADVDPNAMDKQNRTPLSWAAENGHVRLVKLLLDNPKVDPDSKDHLEQTPLLLAAKNGHAAIVKLLLDTGKISWNTNDKLGGTPLRYAAEFGHNETVKQLVESCKCKDAHDTLLSLLWSAAANGKVSTIRTLIGSNKVDINALDNSGRTALALATTNGHPRVVELLLETGKVDWNAKDKMNGWTPLEYAAYDGQTEVVQQLIRSCKCNDAHNVVLSLLWSAAANGYMSTIKTLLNSTEIDLNTRDKEGRTALHWAAAGGRLALVKLLTSTDFDQDAKDVYGATALLLAVNSGKYAVVKLLLDMHKFDPDSKDTSGRTSLSYAAGAGNADIVRLLLETGKTDPAAEDKEGRTPVYWARTHGHEAIVKLLEGATKIGPEQRHQVGEEESS